VSDILLRDVGGLAGNGVCGGLVLCVEMAGAELRRSQRHGTDSPFGEGGGVILLASLVLILSIGFFGAGYSGPGGLYTAVVSTSCDGARRGDVNPKMVVTFFPIIDFSATFPFSFFFFKVRVKWGMW
jgi:hypothetical protein